MLSTGFVYDATSLWLLSGWPFQGGLCGQRDTHMHSFCLSQFWPAYHLHLMTGIGSAPKHIFESWTGACGGEGEDRIIETESAIRWAMNRTGQITALSFQLLTNAARETRHADLADAY